MTNPFIASAAEFIAKIDAPLAKAFVEQPFRRHQIVTAFHKSLSESNLQPIADKAAVFLRSVIDKTEKTA